MSPGVAQPRVTRYGAPSASRRRSSLPPNRYGPPVPTPAGMLAEQGVHQLVQPRLDVVDA